MSDIFLSYASEDRERIRPLVNVLEKTGWSVFWDRTIPTGKTWRQVLGKEIREAGAIVVLWTSTSVDSDWVQDEAEEGKRRQILFPVMLDEVVPPFGFGSIQSADLVNWDGSGEPGNLSLLIADLSRVLGPRPAPLKADDKSGRERKEKKPQAEALSDETTAAQKSGVSAQPLSSAEAISAERQSQAKPTVPDEGDLEYKIIDGPVGGKNLPEKPVRRFSLGMLQAAFVLIAIVAVILVVFMPGTPPPIEVVEDSFTEGIPDSESRSRILREDNRYVFDVLMQEGKNVYDKRCAGCHGASGEGILHAMPAIVNNPVVKGDIRNHIITVVNGRPGTAMTAFKDQLNDRDLAAVITYQRNAFDNNTGDIIQPSDIAEVRSVLSGIESATTASARVNELGKEIYERSCVACHAVGVAGAPKVGQRADWEPRVQTGLAALLTSTIKGKGAMPSRGGSRHSDAEIEAAILFMLQESGF